MLGSTCQVVRVLSTFAPCLGHFCAGGGGCSVANVGLVVRDSVGGHRYFTSLHTCTE